MTWQKDWDNQNIEILGVTDLDSLVAGIWRLPVEIRSVAKDIVKQDILLKKGGKQSNETIAYAYRDKLPCIFLPFGDLHGSCSCRTGRNSNLDFRYRNKCGYLNQMRNRKQHNY